MKSAVVYRHMLKVRRKKRLVLGVTGSIASYKSAELSRYFIKRGYDVRVVMTESAAKFISPLTFESLTRNPVNIGFWSETQPGSIGHIELADWADVVLIAPATADCIAKLAWGAAESSVLAVALATKASIVLAPAMNVNMYSNQQTQQNLDSLQSRGVVVVAPAVGDLACGWKGSGRLAPLNEIYSQVERIIGPGDLTGLRVLISAGPTREALDPVRYISNRSSGKMGISLAREAYRRGAEVVLVHGPLATSKNLPKGIDLVPVISAEQMFEALISRAANSSPGFDVIVMAAAVADFRPVVEHSKKIKKSHNIPAIELCPTKDILEELGQNRVKNSRPILVGFAVETGEVGDLLEEAFAKLSRKNLDVVVGNLAQDAFDKDTNQVWIVDTQKRVVHLDTSSKAKIAGGIWQCVLECLG